MYKKSQNNKNNAFSLIELMVVIAIVGILAAVAVPAYKNYTLKAEVSRAFSILEGAKQRALDNYARTGFLDGIAADNLPGIQEVTGDDRNPYIFIRSVAGGFIERYCTADYPNNLGYVSIMFANPEIYTNPANGGGYIALIPIEEGDVIRWVCVNNNVDPVNLDYFPSDCQPCL